MGKAPGFPGLCRILVVDDDPDLRSMLCRLLENDGYQVESADCGTAAWEHLRTQPCDLVVTDHHMAGLSGLGLLRRLHAARWNLPVIMVSGDPPDQELRSQPWLKLRALFRKPFDSSALREAVRGALEPAPLRTTPHSTGFSAG